MPSVESTFLLRLANCNYKWLFQILLCYVISYLTLVVFDLETKLEWETGRAGYITLNVYFTLEYEYFFFEHLH